MGLINERGKDTTTLADTLVPKKLTLGVWSHINRTVLLQPHILGIHFVQTLTKHSFNLPNQSIVFCANFLMGFDYLGKVRIVTQFTILFKQF